MGLNYLIQHGSCLGSRCFVERGTAQPGKMGVVAAKAHDLIFFFFFFFFFFFSQIFPNYYAAKLVIWKVNFRELTFHLEF